MSERLAYAYCNDCDVFYFLLYPPRDQCPKCASTNIVPPPSDRIPTPRTRTGPLRFVFRDDQAVRDTA